MDARTGEMAARLHASATRLMRVARRDQDKASIGGPRLSALSFIVLAGTVSLAELAAAEQVRPPSMTRVVDDLVADGLVTREQDPKDRRAVRIAATADGRRVMEDGRDRGLAALCGRLRLLAESERRALYRGIELLERMLQN